MNIGIEFLQGRVRKSKLGFYNSVTKQLSLDSTATLLRLKTGGKFLPTSQVKFIPEECTHPNIDSIAKGSALSTVLYKNPD